ncbi:hypothetical protein OG21DRAFT_1028639 [Imleria badia]|nr:hypothetical protein OG21DRAFT_1028639 [Imleria badia]
MGIAFCFAGSACLCFGSVVVVLVGGGDGGGRWGKGRGRGRGRGRGYKAERDGKETREGDRGGLVLVVDVIDVVLVLVVGIAIIIGIKVVLVIGIKAVIVVIDPVDTIVGPNRLESPRARNLLLNESAEMCERRIGGCKGVWDVPYYAVFFVVGARAATERFIRCLSGFACEIDAEELRGFAIRATDGGGERHIDCWWAMESVAFLCRRVSLSTVVNASEVSKNRLPVVSPCLYWHAHKNLPLLSSNVSILNDACPP